jgi:parvulin-like peptidyl-prolyl isomerase
MCAGVYTTSFGNAFFSKVAVVLPFPVVKVNGDFLFYRNTLKRYEGLTKFSSLNESLSMDSSEMKRRLFDSLVREVFVNQIIEDRDEVVPEELVSQMMQELREQTDSNDDFEKKINDNYGWSLNEFKKYIVEPLVNAKYLEEKLLSDRELQADKRKLVNRVYEKIQNGAHFDGMVLEFSEDATKIFNGDFGWMTEEEMPEEWRSPATRLDIGGISPVIEERDRFVILRIDDKKTVEAGVPNIDDGNEGNDIEKSEVTSVNFSAIVINKISLSDVVDKFVKESDVKIFVRL